MSNNANSFLKYPQRERASAFLSDGNAPFTEATVGITYPGQEYYIEREPNSRVNVFELILEGEGELFLDGRWQRAEAGDVYILCAGEHHRYRSGRKNSWKKVWINYSAPYMDAMLSAYGLKSSIYHGAVSHLSECFAELRRYAEGTESSPEAALRIAELAHRVVQALAKINLPKNDAAGAIRSHLDSSVYKRISLDELSAELHISKSQLIRIFKQKYGITPYEYLLGQKITAAGLLLRSTDMTVREVAERVAIYDEHYFSNLFLRFTGSRPRNYRKEGAKNTDIPSPV